MYLKTNFVAILLNRQRIITIQNLLILKKLINYMQQEYSFSNYENNKYYKIIS